MSYSDGNLSQRTQVRLKQFLAALPDMLSARLAHAVEADRARGGTGLPHREILDALRPRLRRVYEMRSREKKDLLRVLEAAPREVRAALPIKTMGGFGMNDAPLDLSRPPVQKKFRRAEGFAQILTQLNGLAATYGLGKRLMTARAEMVSSVRMFQRGLVREIRAARCGDCAEAYRQPALELGAQVLGDGEVAELRRARPLG